MLRDNRPCMSGMLQDTECEAEDWLHAGKTRNRFPHILVHQDLDCRPTIALEQRTGEPVAIAVPQVYIQRDVTKKGIVKHGNSRIQRKQSIQDADMELRVANLIDDTVKAPGDLGESCLIDHRKN